MERRGERERGESGARAMIVGGRDGERWREREREVDLPLYCYSRQPSELRGKDAHVQSSLRWTVLPVVLLHRHHYCPSAPSAPSAPWRAVELQQRSQQLTVPFACPGLRINGAAHFPAVSIEQIPSCALARLLPFPYPPFTHPPDMYQIHRRCCLASCSLSSSFPLASFAPRSAASTGTLSLAPCAASCRP